MKEKKSNQTKQFGLQADLILNSFIFIINMFNRIKKALIRCGVGQRRLDKEIIRASQNGEQIPLPVYYASRRRINNADVARTKRIIKSKSK